ncbi:MAG TPA: hypothetical protein VNT01_17040 [Symbiobacteriaceae bacterium]|nr:hypothetical protein [Symbiobacteriaceae bacterium]
MKRIMLALLALAAITATACSKPEGGNGKVGTAAPTVAPPAKADTGAKPSSVGGTYKGKVQRGFEITFDVSPDGKAVTKVAANVLESCTGSSTSRTTQLYWDGPFPVSAGGVVSVEGPDPEWQGIEFRFTARLGADGTAAGTVLQKGAGCTTYELQWTATKE